MGRSWRRDHSAVGRVWQQRNHDRIADSAGGLSGSIVVTSDSTAISALEHKIAALPGTGVTLSNGDKHSGAHVCGFSVGKNGHTYQVDAYGSLPASSCSASIQALFLANAP